VLIDRVVVRAIAGTGGSGASSFARFKYKPKGGPDGGDGGRGGSVFVKADPNLGTLLDYRYRNVWKADRGAHGKGKTMTGRSSDDLYFPVPLGTEVRDAETGAWLGEVVRPGEVFCVAKGGRGGRGNAAFATPTHQAPREWEPGEPGEARSLELVLKLIADAGLVGQPNAGKSTLLSVLSAARPKIADYPFTTLEPNLGVVSMGEFRSFVLADIPGILEGAHEGKGLGLTFLRHIERTRVLAFLLPLDGPDPQGDYETLRRELRAYSEALYDKPHIVALTKLDLLPADTPPPTIEAPEAETVIALSAASGAGVPEFRAALFRLVEASKAAEGAEDDLAIEPESWDG